LVTLNRIYTRTGDNGTTALANGQTVSKTDLRVAAYGEVDETNSCIGLARVHTAGQALDGILARLQSELFDLGADLATPAKVNETEGSVLRILEGQIQRLEAEIDQLNEALPPLTSFVLPGGSAAAAALHLARTVARRAERSAIALVQSGQTVSPPALRYLNRLSDLLFVAARAANASGPGDVFWKSGATR